jgi:dTDP-glucose 4,6-dehydratase
MKILVTGGKGVVGSSLVMELSARGHDVWVCDLKHSHEANYLRCDVTRYRPLLKLFIEHNFDFVYHLAAEFGRWNGEDYYEEMWMTNVVGTKNLLRLQEKFGFNMVFASSSEVYGDYQGIMTEDVMEKVAIKQMNDYAISKWANELQILNARLIHDNKVVRVRIFNTYGPGEYYSPYRSAVCLFTYRALFDLPCIVYLNHQRTSIYINDCSIFLANIVDNFKPGEVYNIAGSELHDMKSVSDMILTCLNKDDNHIEYREEEPFTAKIKIPDIRKAMGDLSYKPRITLKEGIPLTVEWMKRVYNI